MSELYRETDSFMKADFVIEGDFGATTCLIRDPQAEMNAAFAEVTRVALTDLCLHDPWLLWQYAESCEKSGMDKAASLLRIMADALQVVRLTEKEQQTVNPSTSPATAEDKEQEG